LACWWAAYAWLPESWIPYISLAGLLTGCLADGFILKKLLVSRLSLLFWIAVFLFYSIGVFGFSMGVPLLNAALAIPAGFVIGARLAEENAEWGQVREVARHTAWFTSAVLALICTASATIALLSSSTASDLRGMLGLNFEVTHAMLVGFILIGGTSLLAGSWGLALAAVRITFSFLHPQA
jgi:hypothetical protein